MKSLALLPLLLLACSDGPPTTPETRPVEDPNAGNTAIYDVDPDDPYEIGDGEFLDMRPGDSLATFEDFLLPGTLRSGEGEFDVHYIRGRRQDTLGFVFSREHEGTLIESIYITSPNAVTQDGIRVGNTYAELYERRGAVPVTGSEVEMRVYASDPPFRYRLDRIAGPGALDSADIEPNTSILAIIIE